MFADVNNKLKSELNIFQETIKDSFGNSIVQEIYEPMINDINMLEQIEDSIKAKLMEIDSNLFEIRSMV